MIFFYQDSGCFPASFHVRMNEAIGLSVVTVFCSKRTGSGDIRLFECSSFPREMREWRVEKKEDEGEEEGKEGGKTHLSHLVQK